MIRIPKEGRITIAVSMEEKEFINEWCFNNHRSVSSLGAAQLLKYVRERKAEEEKAKKQGKWRLGK